MLRQGVVDGLKLAAAVAGAAVVVLIILPQVAGVVGLLGI
jgi:hypothetical protein